MTTQVICDLDTLAAFTMAEGNHNWSLRDLLMQVTHPTNETCAFFQAIDNYSMGQGVTFTMLPSTATFGCNAILGLILFTWWLLELVYGKRQSYNLDVAFHPTALQEMASATWDENNNCIQQKEGDLLSRALKDLEIYDLRPKQDLTPPVTVMVDTAGIALQAAAGPTGHTPQNQQIPSAQHTPTQQHDTDSLTNSIQSQNTMFTQAIHQMDTLAERQAAFENNTQNALEMIMNQLAQLTHQNCKRQHHQNYSDSQTRNTRRKTPALKLPLMTPWRRTLARHNDSTRKGC